MSEPHSTATPDNPHFIVPPKKFRNASWTGDIKTATDFRVSYYATKEARDRRADGLAALGKTVHTELWDESHVHDSLNRGWALDGHRDPVKPT